MPEPRLHLMWEKHPRFPTTWVASLPDGTWVTIFVGGNIFIERACPTDAKGVAPARVETIKRLTGGTVEAAQLIAEQWAAQTYPLSALGQLGKKNPSTKLEAKLAKVEALRRGAKTPGERKAAQAAYDRIVNQLLSAPPPEPEPRRAPPPGVDRKELRETRRLLGQALRAVFGPSWGRFDSDTRAGLVDEAYVRWLEAGGHPRVDVHQIALDVRRESRAARDREVGFGQYDSDEPGSFVDPAEAQESREQEARAATLWQLLEDFSERDEVSKMQATIVQLHLGERGFPGQPNRLKGELPQRDLAEFHPGGGDRCPTCRAIARYVRVAGLTPEAVGRTVDGVLVELRQQLG